MKHTPFLVIGAGPYGIATAAYAKSLGVDVTVVGKPLDAWKTQMPRAMLLRSGPDWHLDAREVATFDAYVKERGLPPERTRPLALDTFVDYASWFMGRYDVTPRPAHVTHLQRANSAYVATLDDGSRIEAEQVLLAPGFSLFKHCPPELLQLLPPDSYAHTGDTVDFECFRGKRVLIVGGRQSAYEWAALMNETGAEEIHVSHRHATPKFVESDWSWVLPMVRRTLYDHGWWRKLSADDRERIASDFWAAGRLALEPWLDARVHRPGIQIHEKTAVASVRRRHDATLDVVLSDGSSSNVHRIVLATGYRTDMRNFAFLDGATVLDRLETVDGYPMLDTEFETNLPGLYVTGIAATRDFGPFFGFTVACPVAGKIIGERVANRRRRRQASTRVGAEASVAA